MQRARGKIEQRAEGSPVDSPVAPGLYVVGTPIGNLEDLSPRAKRILRAAAIVAAEDTRTSATLLRIAGRTGRSVSLTEHNVNERLTLLLDAAREGAVALVSDAGTPALADPGSRLVAAAHTAGIPVFTVPGASALSSAVSVSGFDGSDVHFLGFLPRRESERRARLAAAAGGAKTLVFFESPARLAGSLASVAAALNDPHVAVCRELTKVHEEVVLGRASELAPRFSGTRGECTVVVQSPEQERQTPEAAVRAFLGAMRRAGARRGIAASEAARAFTIPRRVAYELWENVAEEP